MTNPNMAIEATRRRLRASLHSCNRMIVSVISHCRSIGIEGRCCTSLPLHARYCNCLPCNHAAQAWLCWSHEPRANQQQVVALRVLHTVNINVHCYVVSFVCVCVHVLTKDGNEYKTTVKPLLKSWLQDVSDKEKMYLIVHVSTATRNELMQSIKLTRSTVDKIRADCPIHKDRYVH
jgi:hypothetical protein